MQWLLTAHVRRYHGQYQSSGHVWQGRFKAFPIQQDDHLLAVLRYIERNPLRTGLVASTEDWLWSSVRERTGESVVLTPSPVPLPKDWVGWVNAPMTDAEVEALRHRVNRGTPFGEEGWVRRTARRLGLEASLRPRGRPRMAIRKVECPLCVLPSLPYFLGLDRQSGQGQRADDLWPGRPAGA